MPYYTHFPLAHLILAHVGRKQSVSVTCGGSSQRGAPCCHSADRTGAATTGSSIHHYLCDVPSVAILLGAAKRRHRRYPLGARWLRQLSRECDGGIVWTVAALTRQVRSCRPDQPDYTKLQSGALNGSLRLEVRSFFYFFFLS